MAELCTFNTGSLVRAPRRVCTTARAQSSKHADKGAENSKGFLDFFREGVQDHDDAIAHPGKHIVRMPGMKGIVAKGMLDINEERKRASALKLSLRSNVQRHDDAIAASGERLKKLPRQIVDRGVEDMKVASQAPLSKHSEVWTFPVGLISYSTLVIAWASELAGSPYSSSICGAVGFLVGAVFSLAHRTASVRLWRAPTTPQNVVITGGTRGIGKAIVREHLRLGDNVFIASRSDRTVHDTISELYGLTTRPNQLAGASCDVSQPGSVTRLASLAQKNFGDRTIDMWINNAGVSGSFKGFLESSPTDIASVVRTNLLGSLLCTRAAIRVMKNQERRGHIFNMDGAGADGSPTPQYTAYGATKAGIAHIMGSAARECDTSEVSVGVHTLSPGMVLTELILDGATNQNKQVFNILCEQPEVAAAYLVTRARSVAARDDSQAYIRFLTGFKALTKFLSAPFLLGRYFSSDGKTTYEPDESVRLDSKATTRAMSNSRTQGEQLQYIYATTLCFTVLMLSIDFSSVNMTEIELPRIGAWVTAAIETSSVTSNLSQISSGM